ncbi:membrane protein [Allofrancisella guangzhouensis]|uniref:Membrane protein n=1 Tax=Allofrancisella guangzhouensis TaxID=594679 RepID=A0A0A8E696_9GAMM|nr:membrane protein [Allofrancisella guangzhouensis]
MFKVAFLSLVFGTNLYAEQNTEVVSQGGPLGSTSIGQQNLSLSGSSPGNNSSSSPGSQHIDEKELLMQLQLQIQQLQGQVNQLKSQQGNFKNTSGGSSQFTTYSSKVGGNNFGSMENYLDLGTQRTSEIDPNDITSSITQENSIAASNSQSGGIFASSRGVDVGGTPAITTQGQVSYLGSYSGNNTIPIAQISDNLFSSNILGQRDKFDDYSVFFGGYIEADAQTWFGSQIQRISGGDFPATGQNIYLTAAKLYFLSNLGHYVTAQFDFDTSESGDFNLGNALVMFGNLDTSPFFLTVGRNYLSVGTYGGGGPWTRGIIKAFLYPERVTNVSLNYKTDTINTNIAVFGSNDKQANFSTGFFYADSLTEKLSAGFNAGYIYNLAGTGNSTITSFLKSRGRENETIGVINFDGNLSYAAFGGNIQVQAGWSATTNAEDFNESGKNVNAGAWYGGINYALVLAGKGTNFNVTYGQSYNAAKIPMGLSNASTAVGKSTFGIRNQLIFSAQRSYFDNNVLFGPEYSYQALYNGEHMNTITLDLSVYV